MTPTKKQSHSNIGPKKNYPRYQNYVDTSIEWLNEIPSEWRLEKIKQTVKGCINGKWGTEPKDDEETTKCIRVADFDFEHIRINAGDLTERVIAEDKKQNRLLEKGDLLLEKSGGGDKQPVGRVVLYDLDLEEAVTSNFIGKMPVREGYDSQFLAYLHKTLYELGVNIRSIKQTTGIQNIDSKQYLDEIVPIPPKRSQKKIVKFLDRETSKIDRLIEKKEKMIDLLEEKRTALISHNVTKGLDEEVEMRESSVEWFGKIPKKWEVTSLRNVVKRFIDYRGATPEKTKEGITLITTKNINNGKLNFSDNQEYISEESYKEWMTRGKPQVGDVLITTEAPLGEVAQIVETPIALAQRIILLRTNEEILDEDYLKYFLNSKFNKTQLMKNKTGSTAKGIRASRLKIIKVFLPPLSEQKDIVREIRKRTSKFDNLIGKINKAIEKLKEYRTALISAAVTGKIDVRGEVE